MNRREFTRKSALASVLLCAMPLPGIASPGSSRAIRKGIMWATIGVGETVAAKFEAVKEAGFEGVEVMSHMDRDEVLAAAGRTGLKIPSVCNALHWEYPLSHPDPAVREKGVDALVHSLEDAAAFGADTVLLVPGRVSAEVTYDQCWERSVPAIRKALPVAERLRVNIAIENVWNNFLLSPLEAARYVDQFGSPFVRFYLDCGNILLYGWPEQWIRILGSRIAKVHIKEFSMHLANTEGRGAGFRAPLLEGDVNWPGVMKALDEIGYTGWAITEQSGGDTPEGLADLVSRLEKILKS
ncbi:MAG: sugar phosphate isomerase/epimerase [Marinilabiliales bacterium]|nr:MAG: sugar phosphate isomerase/epimerase [Marinilabiliales bacterium]